MADGDIIHAIPRRSVAPTSSFLLADHDTWRVKLVSQDLHQHASKQSSSAKRSLSTLDADEPVEVASEATSHDVRDRGGMNSKTRLRKRLRLTGDAGFGPSHSIRADSDNVKLGGNDDELVPHFKSARELVRNGIETHTLPKRQAFLHAHAQYFLPLLPPRNHITKLVDLSHTLPEPVAGQQIRQPEGIKAAMKPYQLEGLSFLVKMFRNGMPAILGDEMGLGKTLQTLSLFQHLRETEATVGEHRPFLVVCPLSVLASWMNETKKWAPSMQAFQIHGPKAERTMMMQQLRSGAVKADLVVTTYEAFAAEDRWFKRAFVWRYVVLDEGHKIKNEQTAVAHALQSLSAEYRLLVTGTPLQNDVGEAWALLHWLLPEVFTEDTQGLFKKSFDLARGSVSTEVMDNLRQLLEIIMLRRMKSSPGVDLGLPPKEEIRLFVPLTKLQREWYLKLLTRIDRATLQDVFQNARSKEATSLVKLHKSDAPDEEQAADIERDPGQWRKLQNLVLQLRKVCSHPYLIKGAEPDPYHLQDEVRLASGKFMVLDKLVDELVIRNKKKILIFSGFTHTLDLIEDLLALKDANTSGGPFKFMRLDGGTARAKRNLGIRLFNDFSTDFRVMLISTRAGGLGINLTSATSVLFLDEDWNPQVTLQAEARAHRIGQTQKVTVYKFCTKGTVEEQMIGRIQKKLYLSTKVTESMRNIHTTAKSRSSSQVEADDGPALGTSQLKSLLRRGAQALTGPEIETEELATWDWETTLAKCKDQPMSSDGDIDEATWLSTVERVETAVFEGKKWQRYQKEKSMPVVDLVRSDRRKGKNTTVMVDGFAIDKTSMLCGDWEAVPTLAGKDPRLAEPKRAKKAAVANQSHCQCCWDGGDLVTCSGCPRSYHIQCLPADFRRKVHGMSFYCPQHECVECGKKTADAGGLIYRCRWCEHGFCEDCLDWEKSTFLDSNLPEFERAGYISTQAWFVECADCLTQEERIPFIDRSGWIIEDDGPRFWTEADGFDEDTMLTFASEGSSTTHSEVATPKSTADASMLALAHHGKTMHAQLLDGLAKKSYTPSALVTASVHKDAVNPWS